MKRPSAILFDWDNTLVDSWFCIQQAMNEALLAMGHEAWDMVETRRRVARSLRDAFPELFGERWEEARDIFYTRFAAVHLDLLKPLPGAAETLQRLHDAGIPLGVVSNKTGKYLRHEAEALGWARYFRHLIGAGDASADKPSSVPVLKVLEFIGVPADRDVWFVGDAAIDMECAANAGISGVLVKHDEWLDGQEIRHLVLRQCQSWEEFAAFLDEILVS